MRSLSTTLWLSCLLLCATAAQGEGSGAIEGFSHPYRSAEVAASTSGIVQKWYVDEGDYVKAGQPLVQLDDSVHRALIKIAEAAVNSQGELALAEAERKLRQQRLDAIRELAKKGHATSDELRRAESEWEVAVARFVTAQENQLRRELELKKLMSQLQHFTVVAPFSGVVTKVHRVSGEYVGPVEPSVCKLVELETLSARFLAPDKAVKNLKNGDQVEVLFPATGAKVTGTVTLSPYPDAETSLRSVTVKIQNQQGELAAGVRCRLVPSTLGGLGQRRWSSTSAQ